MDLVAGAELSSVKESPVYRADALLRRPPINSLLTDQEYHEKT